MSIQVSRVMRYEEHEIYVYSPASDSWTSDPFPSDVAAAFGNHSVNAFYDPVLNAYFFHVAYDSEPDGVIWVYRLAKQ
jgi:hypothetical protein